MFTVTPLPDFGGRHALRRGTAGAAGSVGECIPCRRGAAAGVSTGPSIGSAFLIGAVVLLAMAAL
jgi:hypothetical protein